MKGRIYQALHRIRHDLFEIGILLKGIDAGLEVIGGAVLLFYRTQALNAYVLLMTQHELAEDPRDFFATRVMGYFTQLSVDSKTFGGVYLMAHGLIKIALVAAIFRKKSWAYPTLVVFLAAFAAYQGYRFAYSGSGLMAFLAVFDASLAILVWREYRAVRARLAARPPELPTV